MGEIALIAILPIPFSIVEPANLISSYFKTFTHFFLLSKGLRNIECQSSHIF